MQIVSRSILRVGRVGSALPRFGRWWLSPAVARRDAPPILSAAAHSKRYLDLFLYKPWRSCLVVPMNYACTKCMDTKGTRKEVTKEATKKFQENNPMEDNIYFAHVYKNSSHRDGAIYKNKFLQEDFFEGDIADRNETSLEPMLFSKSTKQCFPDAENCRFHFPQELIQIFSVVLSKSPISNGSIQLYGYIAARDEKDGMLNYIVNYSRDDPIVVQQGSFIEMTGPKRAIKICSIVLIEFDMRIKTGEQEEDDQVLIDGAMTYCDYMASWESVKQRITGNCGAVDISLSRIEEAVEATIEVVILDLLSGLSLSLCSMVDVMGNYEEIQLFCGTIAHPGALRRFVVAVTLGTEMLLKFNVCNDVEQSLHGVASQQIKFQAKQHGCANRQIKFKLTSISVKVTWSTI